MTFRLLGKNFCEAKKNEVFKLSALAALWQNISAKQKKNTF